MSLFASSSRVTVEGVPSFTPFSTLDNAAERPRPQRPLRTRRKRRSTAAPSAAVPIASAAATFGSSSEGDTPEAHDPFQAEDSAQSLDEEPLFPPDFHLTSVLRSAADRDKLVERLTIDALVSDVKSVSPGDTAMSRAVVELEAYKEQRRKQITPDLEDEILKPDDPFPLPHPDALQNMLHWPDLQTKRAVDVDDELDILVRDQAKRAGKTWIRSRRRHLSGRARSAYTGTGPFAHIHQAKRAGLRADGDQDEPMATEAFMTAATEVASESSEEEDLDHPYPASLKSELSLRLDQLLAQMALNTPRSQFLPAIDIGALKKRNRSLALSQREKLSRPPLNWTHVIDSIKQLPDVPSEVVTVMTERLKAMFALPDQDLPDPAPYQPPTLQTKNLQKLIDETQQEIENVGRERQGLEHTSQRRKTRASAGRHTEVLWPFAQAGGRSKHATRSAPGSRRGSVGEGATRPRSRSASVKAGPSRAASVPLKRKASQPRQKKGGRKVVVIGRRHGPGRKGQTIDAATEFKSAEWISDSDVSD